MATSAEIDALQEALRFLQRVEQNAALQEQVREEATSLDALLLIAEASGARTTASALDEALQTQLRLRWTTAMLRARTR